MSDLVNFRENSDISITIPCSQADLGDFISSLLGKKQVISRLSFGTFCIDYDEIENFAHLIQQRIKDQNDYRLVSTIISVGYNDSSSIEHHSLEEMKKYSELRPVIPVRVSMTMIYLIKFQDRKMPEKQQIEIDFMFTSDLRFYDDENYGGYGFISDDEIIGTPYSSPYNGSGAIGFRISHTSRTWGVDIENLLISHITSILKSNEKWRRIVRRWRSLVSDVLAIFTFSWVVWIFASLIASFSVSVYNDSMGKFSNATEGDKITVGLEIMINHTIMGVEKIQSLGPILAGTLAVTFAILSRVLVRRALSVKEPSFILLSRKARELMPAKIKKYEKRWTRVLLFIFGNIILGVGGNLVYESFFKLNLNIPSRSTPAAPDATVPPSPLPARGG